MIQVAIADHHPIVRRGLDHIFKLEGDMALVVEAQTGDGLLQRLDQRRCEVVVLEIGLPDASGIDLLTELRARWPGLPVVVFSVCPAARFAAAAIRAGASAYLGKEAPTEELVWAVRQALAGRRYITPAVAEALAAAVQAESARAGESALSPRERQVLALYSRGKTMTEIAETTGLSVRTVSTYKTRILGKLSLRTNTELLAYAIRNGFTETVMDPDG